MDAVEQYIISRRDIPPALVEALLEAYKICHQDEPDGNIERASDFPISDDGLYFQRQSDACLIGRANVPSLLNPPQGFSSPIAGPSRLHDSSTTNIVFESNSGKQKIPSVDATTVYNHIKSIINQISGGNISEELAHRYETVIQSTVNNASIAWFNLLAFAVDNQPMQERVQQSFYRNIINGKMVTEFRIADHYTVISRKFKGKKRRNPKAQQHTSVNLHDAAKTQALGKNKKNIGEGKPGAQFDSSDTRIGIVEITFDLVKLTQAKPDEKKNIVISMLKSLARLVSLHDASPDNVKSVMSKESTLDGKYKVDTNISEQPEKKTTPNINTDNEAKTPKEESVGVAQYLAFVDRLGEVTGQKALCEAAKEGFMVCYNNSTYVC